MTKIVQEECNALVEEYMNCISCNEDPSMVRNMLFTKLLPYISRWVKSFFNKRKSFCSENELLALSWDGFMFALDKYKNRGIPLPSHFHTYINYYLLSNAFDSTKIAYVELDDDFTHDEGDMNFPIIGAIEFLSLYRNSLNATYRLIFDDAVSGKMSNFYGDKLRMKGDNQKYIPFYRYNEVKKVFRSLIEFFLLKC